MKKKLSELKPGDVIRTEYGDYDNWVTVEIIQINAVEQKYFEMIVRYAKTSKKEEPFKMYSFSNNLEDVISEGGK